MKSLDYRPGSNSTRQSQTINKMEKSIPRKIQTPMFSNNISIKDKIDELTKKANSINIALDSQLKERRYNEDNIINNILNADSYRYKSNLLNSNNEVSKNNNNEYGKYNF